MKNTENYVQWDNTVLNYELQHILSSTSYPFWACANKIGNWHVELPSLLNGVLSHFCFHSFTFSLMHTKHVYELTSPKEARNMFVLEHSDTNK